MTERTIPIPKELNHKSNSLALAGCLYSFALYFGAWIGVGYLWTYSSWAWWVTGLVSLPLLLVGGYGMLLMGFMGHDGTHFNLHSNRIVSSILGIIITAPIFPYMLMGFTISHWSHHKFTNGDQDPDAVLFSKFKNLFTRAFIARPYTFFEYGVNTFRLALGIPLPFSYQFPLSPRTAQWLAIFNIGASALSALGYAWVAVSWPVYFAALGAVYVFGTVISGLSPYIEHTGTGEGRGVDTRTAQGWWWDVFILGNNYHLEHHLYPTIPFYNLRRVHYHLIRNGYYTPEKFLSRGIWGTYRYAVSKYPYPSFHHEKK